VRQASGDDVSQRARLLRIAAFSLIAAGTLLTIFGGVWAPAVPDFVAGSKTGAWIELVLPFGPHVLVACGAALLPLSRR